jgi:vitamin B12 transporter
MDARTINSYYGGYSVVAGKNILQMNVRQDENSQFGESRTYRLGYAYRLDGQWKLYGSKSTAFKAPSFNDLYFPNTLYVGVGNPNLKPETSTNYEYGISKSGEVYEFGVTHFVSKISNLISWAETAPSSFFYSPSNIGSANISGYEFRAKYKFRSYEFGFNYTAQNPIDALTRNQLIRKAKEFGSVYLTYQSADWRISPIFTVVGKTYDDSSNLRGIPGYGLLGVNVQKKMTQEVSMYLNANNILNKDHNVSITSSSVATGMPFTFMVGLKYQPK